MTNKYSSHYWSKKWRLQGIYGLSTAEGFVYHSDLDQVGVAQSCLRSHKRLVVTCAIDVAGVKSDVGFLAAERE